MEFALLLEEKKLDEKTPIVTSVHSLQILDEKLPMTEHDIPLTAIVTPEEISETRSRLKRPKGIYWHILPGDKVEAIPVLQERWKMSR